MATAAASSTELGNISIPLLVTNPTKDPFDVDFWLEAALSGQYLNEKQVSCLCDKVRELLLLENNVESVSSPVTVVGDIHGQFYDLRKLFQISKIESGTKYVFLGDYVDRGYYSLESLTLLLILKVKFPERFTLIRGNHETRQITQTYGFYDECNNKYGNTTCWKLFCELFDAMPIAALIDNKILCIHGGLTPLIKSIDNIDQIDRFCEVPNSGPFCHLLWSDPEDNMLEDWAISSRGAGVLFNKKPHSEFMHTNGLDLLCRAHQVVKEGIKYMFDETLVTVWSAPNYCYHCGNLASVLELGSNGSKNAIIFDAFADEERKVPEKVVTPYFL